MDDPIKTRMHKVRKWLEENVQVYPQPHAVTLSEFSVDWEEFSGEFKVSFDTVVLPYKFDFGLDASGKTTFYMPMFHSPLCVPASYAAISITEKTENAILEGLRMSIPRIKGAGLDRKTGKFISYHTPPNERIEQSILEEAKRTVTDSYSITVNI